MPHSTKPVAPAFALDPARLGLPNRDELVEMRIWDSHFHGFDAMDEIYPFFERMGIERLFSLGYGSFWEARTPAAKLQRDQTMARQLEHWKDRVSGFIVIDPSDPGGSVDYMERWIKNGPMIGIKYGGGGEKGLTCAHSNNDPIIRLAAELGAVIYIHTWIKVGGTPRTPGGGNSPGESTPMDVAALAKRFPDVPMICGHSGGDWELGTRAVRPHPNVLFEFSGGDAWAGAGDLAVKELGADRIVWGSHAPSRSFATELSKLYSADASKKDLKKMLGGNLRRISAPILRSKGLSVEL